MNSIKDYKVVIGPKLKKSLKKDLSSNLRRVFNRKLKYLAENPYHTGLNTKKIGATEKQCRELGIDEVWEFYINLRLRCIIYVVHSEKSLIIASITSHEDIVRKFGV